VLFLNNRVFLHDFVLVHIHEVNTTAAIILGLSKVVCKFTLDLFDLSLVIRIINVSFDNIAAQFALHLSHFDYIRVNLLFLGKKG
jgi:hypothetical protein